MRTETLVSHTTVLSLTWEEATWLRNVMQNPLYGQSLEDEDEQDRTLRETFFKALTKSIGE